MKTAALLTLPLVTLAQGPHYPGDPFDVTKYAGNFTISKVNLITTDGHAHFTERGLVALSIEGIVNKQLTDGNIAYQTFEQGIKGKVDSGAFAYFKCSNKGCDPSEPMYMTLADPKDQVGKGFKASIPLQLPYQQKTGQMTVSVIGSDQHHYPSDFTLGVQFNYTNTKEDGVEIVGTPKIQATLMTKPEVLAATHVESGGKTQCTADVDCPSSYCMVKTNAPFFCHDCGDNCCNSDADCGKSYCMSGPDKTAPFSCHGGTKTINTNAATNTKINALNEYGNAVLKLKQAAKRVMLIKKFMEIVGSGGKTQCTADVDCPSSYCMLSRCSIFVCVCHDCGDNCCNSDEDCPESYCMSGPGKVAPYSCHSH